jgi:hypothetical protein
LYCFPGTKVLALLVQKYKILTQKLTMQMQTRGQEEEEQEEQEEEREEGGLRVSVWVL